MGGSERSGVKVGELSVWEALHGPDSRGTRSFFRPPFCMLDSEVDSLQFIWKISKMQGNHKTKLDVYVQIIYSDFRITLLHS